MDWVAVDRVGTACVAAGEAAGPAGHGALSGSPAARGIPIGPDGGAVTPAGGGNADVMCGRGGGNGPATGASCAFLRLFVYSLHKIRDEGICRKRT